jgi:hypothetical protein
MARLIRKCTNCGTLDERRSWTSLDEAANQGAWEDSWTCGSCAWTEFELSEAEEEPARA